MTQPAVVDFSWCLFVFTHSLGVRSEAVHSIRSSYSTVENRQPGRPRKGVPERKASYNDVASDEAVLVSYDVWLVLVRDLRAMDPICSFSFMRNACAYSFRPA